MLRVSIRPRFRHPRNTDVGPEYDRWFEKYDSWAAFNKMRKLAGTGFYVPPDWYQHFRMFPPPHNLAREEHTLNPHAHDPHIKTDFEKNEDRQNLRDELARASRSAASAGNRYMNIFWVQKPLDEMERSYYAYTADHGMTHEEAFRRVVDEYYAKQAVRMRVRQIQREEAALSGKCLSMKEGIALIHTLSTLQREQLPPQELATLSEGIREAHKTHNKHTTFRHTVKKKSVQEMEDILAGKPKADGEVLAGTEVNTNENSDKAADELNVVEQEPDTKPKLRPEEETEVIEAPASLLDNNTMSVARERVARKGAYDSSWYSSAQEENAEMQPVAVKEEVKEKKEDEKGKDSKDPKDTKKPVGSPQKREPLRINPVPRRADSRKPPESSKPVRRPNLGINLRKNT